MAGFPVDAFPRHRNRLLHEERAVVLFDQQIANHEQLTAEDGSRGKRPVVRRISRVLTPGTRDDDEGVDVRRSNYLMSVSVDRRRWALAFVDLAVGGEVHACCGDDFASL